LKSLRSLHRARTENLPDGLPVEASWEILLDLYVSELRMERISLTAIGGSSGVPLTSALRRMQELESKELIARVPDEKDKRRAAAQLTEKGRLAVQSFIRAYVKSCRCAQIPSDD
jgi:DNA-binding MarR family transcriptional regulator